MSGCFVTIFQTSLPCLVIGGDSGLSTLSQRSWSVSLPPRSPELLRTRSEMLPQSVHSPLPDLVYNDHLLPSPLSLSPSMTTTFSDDSDVTIPYHFSPISPLTLPISPYTPELCACIWPSLASWCLVCNNNDIH